MPVASAKFDLSFALAEERTPDGAPAGINGVLEYASDLFEEASAATLAERLVRLLDRRRSRSPRARSAASTFSRPPSAAPSCVDWNDTARAVPDATLPELFAAQAARTPDAIALVFEDQTLTYRELDARANQLAHHLRSLGAGPETIVGVCVERSFDMVVALLGILKAGAAYLPLDPDYPAERLAYMLKEAKPRLLLTQDNAARRAARPPARRSASTADRARHRPPARPSPRHQRRPRITCLRHLHVGIDRTAERDLRAAGRGGAAGP